MAAQMKKKGEFPLSNTDMFRHAVRAAKLKVDGTQIDFLPVWRGSAERYEDHQPLSKYQKEHKATIDCTHFCVHGNVHRFWNSAIVTVISSMKEKELLSALDSKDASSFSESKFRIG